MAKVWEVQLTLSNGETYYLANAGGPGERAGQSYDAFVARRAPFDGEFVETVDGPAVARAHVVAVSIVPL